MVKNVPFSEIEGLPYERTTVRFVVIVETAQKDKSGKKAVIIFDENSFRKQTKLSGTTVFGNAGKFLGELKGIHTHDEFLKELAKKTRGDA